MMERYVGNNRRLRRKGTARESYKYSSYTTFTYFIYERQRILLPSDTARKGTTTHCVYRSSICVYQGHCWYHQVCTRYKYTTTVTYTSCMF